MAAFYFTVLELVLCDTIYLQNSVEKTANINFKNYHFITTCKAYN